MSKTIIDMSKAMMLESSCGSKECMEAFSNHPFFYVELDTHGNAVFCDLEGNPFWHTTKVTQIYKDYGYGFLQTLNTKYQLVPTPAYYVSLKNYGADIHNIANAELEKALLKVYKETRKVVFLHENKRTGGIKIEFDSFDLDICLEDSADNDNIFELAIMTKDDEIWGREVFRYLNANRLAKIIITAINGTSIERLFYNSIEIENERYN